MAKGLREKVGKQYKGTQRTRKLTTVDTVELGKWTFLIIVSFSREPYEAKVSRTGLTGGMGRRTVRQRALCLPSREHRRVKTRYNALIAALVRGSVAMVPDLFFYQLTLVALV